MVSQKSRLAVRLEEDDNDRAFRERLRAKLVPVEAECAGRLPELARLMGGKGHPAWLADINDQSFKDFDLSRHPEATVGLCAAFPLLACLFACADGSSYIEYASFMRSVFVREGLAPRRVLRGPQRLRVEGL